MVKKIAQAANTLGRRLWGHQQRRFAGDLPVKPNKFVEEAGYRRENIEREFKWDGTTLTRIAVFGFIVPYGIYTLAVKDFEVNDERAGRPPRPLWGSTRV